MYNTLIKLDWKNLFDSFFSSQNSDSPKNLLNFTGSEGSGEKYSMKKIKLFSQKEKIEMMNDGLSGKKNLWQFFEFGESFLKVKKKQGPDRFIFALSHIS